MAIYAFTMGSPVARLFQKLAKIAIQKLDKIVVSSKITPNKKINKFTATGWLQQY